MNSTPFSFDEQLRERNDSMPNANLLQSHRRLELLSDVASELLRSENPQQIVDSLCHKVLIYLNCDVFFNYLVAPEKNCLHLNAFGGVPQEVGESIRWLDYGAAVCGCVAMTGQRIISENIQCSTEKRDALVKSLGVTAYACHPLIAQDRLLGTLSFGSRSCTTFQPDELALMKTVADHIAIAMQRIETQNALKKREEDAREANRAKDHFLAVVSHELRTPLMPVLTTVELLKGRKDLPPEIAADLETIRKGVQHEARIVDDLLNLTRLNRNTLELLQEVTDVHALIQRVADQFQSEFHSQSLKVEIRLTAKMSQSWLDNNRTMQVLANLVSNAVKFTPAGGTITIETSNPEPGRLRVIVRDTGIGIPPELLPKLFVPFEQGEKKITRRYGGMGLGLAIARALVTQQGGTLIARSDGADKGSCFECEFKCVTVATPAQPAAPASPIAEEISPLNVLLVEDHPETLRVLTRLLKVWNCRVTTATSLLDAISHLNDKTFDLLLSDIGLPDGSGTEVMRVAADKGIKGIALSGFGLQEDIERSKQAGFTAHLVKPVNFDELKKLLTTIAA